MPLVILICTKVPNIPDIISGASYRIIIGATALEIPTNTP